MAKARRHKEFAAGERKCKSASDSGLSTLKHARRNVRGRRLDSILSDFMRDVANPLGRQECKDGQPAVYEWFSEHLNLITQPSLRHYVRAAMLKDANMDWTDSVPHGNREPQGAARR